MKVAAFGATFLLLAAFTPAAPTWAAETVTVPELLANPLRLKGKIVQLRGVVDQCSDYSCNVCDSSVASAACIRVASWLVEGIDPDDGSTSRSSQVVLRQLYRFTTSRITARFQFYSQKDQDLDQQSILSRGPGSLEEQIISRPVGSRWLEAVKVQKIERRLAPADGILSPAEDKPLLTPSDKDYLEMVRAIRLYGSPGGSANDGELGPRAYLVDGYDGGWVCTENRGGSLGPWPTKLGHLRPTPTAVFDCVYVQKNQDGRWAVVTGGD